MAVNSELLFLSGGWQMPPAAAQTIAKIGPKAPAGKEFEHDLYLPR